VVVNSCIEARIYRSRRLAVYRSGVTEIPEHLLKRSKERKGASGAASDAGAAVVPATTTASAAAASPAPAGKVARTEGAAPVGPPPAKPDSPVVAAYKERKKIPVWAMMTLSILPVWAFMYVRALEPPTVEVTGPLGAGATAYNQCASCHGGNGEGGVGYAFQDGEITTTFPNIEDQLRWVYLGSDAYVAAGVEIYGDPNRAGGARVSGASGVMPAAGPALGLSDAEILAVVCHERFELGGKDHEGLEYETWCSEESEIYLALEAGTATLVNLHEQFEGILPIGDVPVAGTSANG